jgi:hypothetical protein
MDNSCGVTEIFRNVKVCAIAHMTPARLRPLQPDSTQTAREYLPNIQEFRRAMAAQAVCSIEQSEGQPDPEQRHHSPSE